MPKGIALKDYVEIDGVDLSDFFSQVNPNFAKEQVDVSGFNSTGKNETLIGAETQTIACTVFDAYGTGETWDVLYALYKASDIFTFKSRPDMTLPVGPTNPQIEGNAQITEWSPNRQRGQVGSFPVTFVSGDSDGFDYVET